MMEQNSNLDKYDAIFESVLSEEEHELRLSSEDENKGPMITKVDVKKRKKNLDQENFKNKRPTKKHKETAKDRLLQWNDFYSKSFGIWIQCTKCDKWRKVMEYEEEHEVPEDWCCSMNLSGIKKCDEPEETTNEDFSQVDLIPGTIVWAKYDTYPWWPAIIEDDPDVEEYYWIEKNGTCSYSVTFLDDKVSRAWVSASLVRPFLKPPKRRYLGAKNAKYTPLLAAAEIKAKKAMNMSIQERLQNFSFVHRYNGKWGSPLKIDDSSEDEKDLTKMLLEEMDNIESIEYSDSDCSSISLFKLEKNETDNKFHQKDKSISNNFVNDTRKKKTSDINNKQLNEHSKQECKQSNKDDVTDIDHNEEAKILNKLIDAANVYLDKVDTEETNKISKKAPLSHKGKEPKNTHLKFLKEKTRTQNNIADSVKSTDEKSIASSSSKVKKNKTSVEVAKIKNKKKNKLEYTEEKLDNNEEIKLECTVEKLDNSKENKSEYNEEKLDNNKENNEEKATKSMGKHIGNDRITSGIIEKPTSMPNISSNSKFKPPMKNKSNQVKSNLQQFLYKNKKSEENQNNKNIINDENTVDSINLQNLNNFTEKEEKLVEKEMAEKSIDVNGNEDDTNNNIAEEKISKYTMNTEVDNDVKKGIQKKKILKKDIINKENVENHLGKFSIKKKNGATIISSTAFSKKSVKHKENANKPLEEDLTSPKTQGKIKNVKTKASKEQLTNIMKKKPATKIREQNDLGKKRIKENEDLEIDEVKNGEEAEFTEEENKVTCPSDDEMNGEMPHTDHEVNGEMPYKDSTKENFSFSLDINLQQSEEDSDPFEAE